MRSDDDPENENEGLIFIRPLSFTPTTVAPSTAQLSESDRFLALCKGSIDVGFCDGRCAFAKHGRRANRRWRSLS